MNEEILSRELHRVADAAPVPTDLFPPDLLARRARSRRSRWIAVTATAAAMLLFSISPLGARALSAVGEVFMKMKVDLVRVEPSAESALGNQWSPEVGETIQAESIDGVRMEVTGLSFTDLLAKEPDFPLPTHLPPSADAKVTQTDTFVPGSESVDSRTIGISWRTGGNELFLYLSRRTTPLSPEQIHELAAEIRPGVKIITADPEAEVEQQEVTVNGMTATAVRHGEMWSLFWIGEMEGGSIQGNLPLETLIKVAESIPSLK